MNQELKVVEVLEGVNDAIIDIIYALRREKPSHPETIVEYMDGNINSFNIEGELGEESIPDNWNAVKVEIGNTVTSIGSYAFNSCSRLSSVTIPNSVTNIGEYAFSSCTALSNITLRRTTAPTVQSNTFGNANANYTGRNTYSTKNNVLKVPTGATGYETTGTAWKDTLLDSTKCGFHIEYE